MSMAIFLRAGDVRSRYVAGTFPPLLPIAPSISDLTTLGTSPSPAASPPLEREATRPSAVPPPGEEPIPVPGPAGLSEPPGPAVPRRGPSSVPLPAGLRDGRPMRAADRPVEAPEPAAAVVGASSPVPSAA